MTTGAPEVSEWEFVSRTPVVDYPEYLCEIDAYKRTDGQQVLFCHIRFNKFSPSIWKRFRKEWDTFRFVFDGPLHAIRDGGDIIKWERFVQSIGFKPTGIIVPTNSGARREIYLHTVPNELNPNNLRLH